MPQPAQLLSIPTDALAECCYFLDASSLALLSATCQRLRRLGLREPHWERLCCEELGVRQPDLGGWRATFLRFSQRFEAVWEGEVVLQQVDALLDFCDAHPVLNERWDSLYLRKVEPVPVRVHTTTAADGSCTGRIDYISRSTSAQNPTLPLALCEVMESHRLRITFSKDKRSICFEEEVEGGGGLRFEAQRFGRKALAGTHQCGCFYLHLGHLERQPAGLDAGRSWGGTCFQQDHADRAYPMRLDLKQSAVATGVTHGEVAFPTLGSRTLCAGVHSVLPSASCPAVFSPKMSVRQRPQGTDPFAAPPPALDTLLASAPPRDPHAAHSTQYLFMEYEHLERGPTVVPTQYCAAVLGDVMVGSYHDTQIGNHGTFCLQLHTPKAQPPQAR